MGERSPVFVIAEAGSNWRMGSPARDEAMAHALVDAAKSAGADAVKFQTFRVHDLYAADAGPSRYLAAAGITSSMHDLMSELEMPYPMLSELAAHAASAGIEFMSTAFSPDDLSAVDPHVKRHKVASYELNHVALLEAAARTGKPLIVSTGAAAPEDISFGLETLRDAGATDLTLMQCTAAYPAPPDSLNLLAIPTLRETYGVPVGLSDHSRHPTIGPVAAVALGAVCIEKHFTFDNRLPGPDHAFALTVEELTEMVTAVRLAETTLGTGTKGVQAAEKELQAFAVRAVQARRDISAGEPFLLGENVDILRPGGRRRGLHPRAYRQLEGRRAARPITRGDGVVAEDVDPPL